MRLLLGVEPLADRSGSGRLVWADETRGWLTVKHPVSTAPYALVLLPEEE